MIFYTLNNPVPLERKDDYRSGDYSLLVKSGQIYIFLGMKQLKKISLKDEKIDEELYRFGYKMEA